MAAFLAIAIIIMLMFRQTWVLLFKAFVIFMTMFKWFVVIGFTFILICSPPVYQAFGWTPLSAMFGKQIYKDAIKK